MTAAAPANAAPNHGGEPADRPVTAYEVLGEGDGWASAGAGTTGGSAATPEQVFTVDTRAELIAALAGNALKIVYVSGTIDANADDAGAPLSCADYARDGYTLDAYLAAYDPAVWGWDAEPSGPIEDARVASQVVQRARTAAAGFEPADIIEVYKGTSMTESDNVVNFRRTDVLGAYNTANGTAITNDAGWMPEHRETVHPAVAVPALVSVFAGPTGLR